MSGPVVGIGPAVSRGPGGEVVNYTVKGGGHTWPGGVQYMPKFVVGSVNNDFSGSAAIVEFFSTH